MVEIIALLATISFQEIASLMAVITAGVGLTVSLWTRGRKNAEDSITRVIKLEEDVKDLKEKHSLMVNNIDKLDDSLSLINTKQAVMEFKLDQLQKNISEVFDTCTDISVRNESQFKSTNDVLFSISNSLVKVTTELSMTKKK